ncbi:MAG: biotin-dependent carboxyltransferase [Balneolaceae bacterium]|nr:biotin-dependent carboxyltransferase [Balneolaceae bacterium]MBO6546863.1 biotin-dependent carboxyltransferase [Balneolaceae bacterium]MBO6649223.1 biotin-dependent carboxyltransferase [Balneolaceae bacterium]
MGRLTAIDGGLFTTIQDSGRPGYRKFGVPVSGVMDQKSFRLANWLVGNSKRYPVLECTMKGGKYTFNDEAIIAVTGALMHPKINGEEVPQNQSLKLNTGDELELGFSTRGCRSYIAIKGSLTIKQVMGSCSTYTMGKFGGFKGRKLKSGDVIEWDETKSKDLTRKAPYDQIPYFSSKVRVRIMKGVEWDWLSEESQDGFSGTQFEVSSSSNRMGIRLEGHSLRVPEREMISGPVLPGIIQLPPNGNPIILMQDGQTIGGYPRIAKVLDEDLWRLGQVKPGDKVSFSFT